MRLGEFGSNLVELGLHLPQGDQRQHRLGVLIGPQRRIGPKLIGGTKQLPRKVLEID